MTLFDRLAQALERGRDATHEDEVHLGAPASGYTEAAVLVPVTDRAEPGVILTQRPEWLRSHAGQIAFPGGKLEPGDEGAIAAALREAEEELAIPPAKVRVVGASDSYHSGSGYRITPVIGIIPPDLALVACEDEVADWFEVPLAFLLDSGNAIERTAMWEGRERRYLDMDYEGRRIWGVTAGIVANLSRRLQWQG